MTDQGPVNVGAFSEAAGGRLFPPKHTQKDRRTHTDIHADCVF